MMRDDYPGKIEDTLIDKRQIVPIEIERYSMPMSIKEIAYIFKIHRNTVRQWIRTGVIKCKPCGRSWRVLDSELP